MNTAKKVRGFEVVMDSMRKFPNEEVILPQRETDQSMACDLRALETVTIEPGKMHAFATDVKAYMLPTEGLIMNVRSSMGFKKNLMLVNTQGWIDADFYSNPNNDGNIGVGLFNFGDKPQTIEKGDRIAQVMFIDYKRPDGDDQVEKRKRVGGIGSTGK